MSETRRAKFGDRSATGKNFLDPINTRWPEFAVRTEPDWDQIVPRWDEI